MDTSPYKQSGSNTTFPRFKRSTKRLFILLALLPTALLILGTLAGAVYPKATLRALPLLWLGSGVGAWMLGEPGSHHLGASGITHGLMFLVLGLGLLRRDRAAIAAGMIGVLFYGGMVMTVLPHEPGVS